MSSARIEVLQQENARLSATVADLGERLAEATDQLQSALGRVTQLQQQLDWFKRQLFGRTSEKRLECSTKSSRQTCSRRWASSHSLTRKSPPRRSATAAGSSAGTGAVNECGLRFNETVPVETIQVADPVIETIPEAEREVVGEKVSHRLAQEPGSYKILKYVRQVVKRRDTGDLLTPSAPANVLERTAVDVSFLAGMLVDKFRYHLPLHRQHQRLADSGVRVSRSSLTNWAGRAVVLLEPVCAAQARAYPARRRCRHGRDIRESRPAWRRGRCAPRISDRCTGRRTRLSSTTPRVGRTNMWRRFSGTLRARC